MCTWTRLVCYSSFDIILRVLQIASKLLYIKTIILTNHASPSICNEITLYMDKYWFFANKNHLRQFEELKNLFVSSINLFIFYSLALNYNQCFRCNLIPRTVSWRKGNHYKIMKSLLMLIPFWAFFNIDFATCTVYIEDNKAQLDNAIGLNTYIHEGQHNCHRQNQFLDSLPGSFMGKAKKNMKYRVTSWEKIESRQKTS